MVIVLEARDLAHDYGAVPGVDPLLAALAGVDLRVESGELMVVLGPNGAGKSTLLRALAGLIQPSRGRVLLNKAPLSSLDARARARRIALVPQSLRALPEVRAQTFVGYGRYAHQGFFSRPSAEDRAAVAAALASADVAQFAERPLSELSGGQLQRVLIARALAQEADVLLVDEPTSSLDPEHQIGVFELVARLTGEGRAVALVTHEFNLASQFATRLLLLNEGRTVAEGAVDDVLRRDVLEPVYGRHLAYGTLPVSTGPVGSGSRSQQQRPFVVPWLRPDQ